MSQPFEASEARVRSFLDSIRSGNPIDNGRPWSALDLLTLAGCARAAALTHPPTWIAEDDLGDLDAEKREAVETTYVAEVDATITLLSQVVLHALDNPFGANLGVRDVVRGVLSSDGQGSVSVQLYRPDNPPML